MSEVAGGEHTTLDLRERKLVMEAATLGALLTLFGSAAVPWFLRVLPLALGPAARFAFVYVLVRLALGATADRLAAPRLLLVAIYLLQGLDLAALAVLWHLLGGLNVPLLLLALCLPVLAAGMLLGRLPALGAALWSVLAAGVVGMVESSELSWYLFQLGLPVATLARLLPHAAAPAPLVPGLTQQPAFAFVVLATFATAQLACVALAASLAQAQRLMVERRGTAAAGLGAPGSLFHAALQAVPSPAVVVIADTGEVVLASQSFRTAMMRHGEHLPGRDLLDLVRFGEPDKVRALLREGGEIPFCPYHVGPEARIARLRTYGFEHGGMAYACASFEDCADLFYLQSTLQGLEEPLLVIGSNHRLRYANAAAGRALGELYFGMPAPAGLGASGNGRPDGPGQVEAGGVRFEVSRDTVLLPGRAETVSLLRLRRGASRSER